MQSRTRRTLYELLGGTGLVGLVLLAGWLRSVGMVSASIVLAFAIVWFWVRG